MRRWGLLALLLILAVVLQLKLWEGTGGLQEAQELQARVAAQREENARLKQRNDALEAEVEDLKSGEAAIEDRARSELGMIRPGEVFYRVVESGQADAAAPADADAAANAAGDGKAAPGDGQAAPGDGQAAPADPPP